MSEADLDEAGHPALSPSKRIPDASLINDEPGRDSALFRRLANEAKRVHLAPMNILGGYALLVAALLEVGCKKQAPAKPAGDSVMSGNPALAPLDYLAAQGKAKKFAEKAISTAELTSAIQKFNALEERFPRDLNELAQQHYLQAPPMPPRGMRFLYNAQTGEIRIVPEEAAPVAPAAANER